MEAIHQNTFSQAFPAGQGNGELPSGKNIALLKGEWVTTRKVLIVDDEENIIHAMVRLLRKEPYKLVTANSGAEGLDALAKHPEIAVVLSDHKMPGMMGTDFLQLVKTLYPHVVRLILTGQADVDIVLAAINEGEVFRFLTKPWVDHELKQSLRNALDVFDLQRENKLLLQRVGVPSASKDTKALPPDLQENMVVGLDSEGRIHFTNGAWMRYWAEQDISFSSGLFKEALTDESLAAWPEIWIECLKRKELDAPVNLLLKSHTGQGRTFAAAVYAMGGEGTGKNYLVVLQDLVFFHRRDAVHEYQTRMAEREQQKTLSIIRSLSEGVMVTSLQHRVLYVNSTAEKIFGIRHKDVFGKSIESCIGHSDLIKTIQDKARNGQDDAVEQTISLISRKDHAPKEFAVRTNFYLDDDGSPLGIVTVLSDVTRFKELDTMKSEFVSTAAHELRSPLTSILGFSELLMTRAQLPEEQGKYVTHIHRKALTLKSMVDDLLDLSNIESGKGFSMTLEPCDLRILALEGIEDFKKRSSKHQFQLQATQAPYAIMADASRVTQVFNNLYSNAIKYAPRGGDVTTSISLDGDNILVVIEDQGIGMTPEQIDRAFEKFYRVDYSNSAVEGTGLGLSIVKYILEYHGGKVWLESQYGKGTKVLFTLPSWQAVLKREMSKPFPE